LASLADLRRYNRYVQFEALLKEAPPVADVALVLLTVGLFAVLALVVRAVERL